MSTNPNNCATCDHKKHPDGGHCYMFRDAPTTQCMQHTGHKMFGPQAIMKIMLAVIPPVGGMQ